MENENKRIMTCAYACTALLAALLVLAVVAAAAVVPPARRAIANADQTFSHMEETLTQIDTLAETAEAALVSANAAADSANRLVADNADEVAEAMAKINAIDFEALNKAIKDLADVVEPLAKVSNFFNR